MFTLDVNDDLTVRIFLASNNRSVGIVLSRNAKDIASESFDESNRRRVKTLCLRWCTTRFRLDDQSRVAIITAVEGVWDSIQAHIERGPDIANDWPGSRSQREIPHIND